MRSACQGKLNTKYIYVFNSCVNTQRDAMVCERITDLWPPLVSYCCRVRMVANVYAFAFGPVDIEKARNDLLFELSLLRKDYDALLYGGSIDTIVS